MPAANPVALDLELPSGRLRPALGGRIRAVPQARVVDVDANHYGIITAEASASAIADFFAAAQGTGAQSAPR